MLDNRYIGNSWKNNAREDAIAAGIFSINMDFKTDTMISREQAAWMVYNALNWDGVRHDTITIPEMKPDSQLLNIKTEDAEVSNSNISGLPAVIIDKNGRTSILLTDEKNGFFYIVITSSGIDFETSSKIAKNLII